MEKIIIIRYSEIHLKGDNRAYFERLLANNIKAKLSGLDFSLNIIRGRFLISNYSDEKEILSRLSYVFGIHSYSRAYCVSTSQENIKEAALKCAQNSGTFKVETNRADKTYPYTSLQISAEVGGYILSKLPNLKVDLHNPDFIINVDIRENGQTFVFSNFEKGLGGLPVGCSGKGLLMLSGGIDSPVAAYMMSKRGLSLKAIHFFSFPYTSEYAKDKVIRLTKLLSQYNKDIELIIIPFTKLQEKIHNLNTAYTVTLMRRYMMQIANIVAQKYGCQTIITGESLGQVASQTIESITVTNEIAKIPVLRPLIAFDKEEIIEISRKINTYEISIEPYDDCCTVFVPKHPVTKPKISEILSMEEKLDMDDLVLQAAEEAEIISNF